MTEQPLPGPASSWRAALATRANAALASGPSAPASRRLSSISRRRFLLGAFATTLGGALGIATSTLLDFLYPRGVKRSGGPFPAGHVTDYPRGDPPVLNEPGHFYLVNLDPADDRANGSGGGDGLLALWRKCPHLGCVVPWKADFGYVDERGWFRCPCHQSTYTKAGLRVFGPAPRPMDTFAVEVAPDGSITVHTDQVTKGGDDNPTRAVPIG